MDMLFFLRTSPDFDPCRHALAPRPLTIPMVGASLALQALTMAVATATTHPAEPPSGAVSVWPVALAWCVLHLALGYVTIVALGEVTGTPSQHRPPWPSCAFMLALVNSGLTGLAFFVATHVFVPLGWLTPSAAPYLTSIVLGCAWLGGGLLKAALDARADTPCSHRRHDPDRRRDPDPHHYHGPRWHG